jgi:glycerate-2-kinase
MARAVVTELKDYVYGGAIITKYDHVPHTLDLHPIKVNDASHPLPDEQGVRGTQEILRQLQNTGKDTLVLCLISGGGSALMVAPADGITLEEKQITTNLLLRSGATIIELNAVRKHISAVKGGGSPKLPTHLQFCR